MATAAEQISDRRRLALIVDDSRVACAVLSRLLAQEGFESELAASAYEALELARERRPDVIFMDHRMPGMTGLEAVRALKADTRTATVPVVMFSSREDAEFLRAAREAGAVAVLTKHTERTNLGPVLAKLREALGTPARARPAPSRPVLPAKHRPMPGLTRSDLHAELAQMLDAQHDRIHTELLAESAMLEQHQERMLRTLTGRLQLLLGRVVRELTSQLTDQLVPPAKPPRARWPRRLAWGGLLAAGLALLTIPVVLVIEQGQRLERLAASGAGFRATLDQQSAAVELLGLQLDDLGQQVAERSDRLQQAADELRRLQASGVSLPAGEADPRALEALLTAAEVFGPVELHTTQGAFCLERLGDGYRLTKLGAPGGACVPGAESGVVADVTPAVIRGY